MASDSLKQIGKYIGKTGKDADRALKRVSPIQPRLERVRDVFDPSTEFSMAFNVLESDERVLLDLFFQLPPPIRGCKVGCIFTKCEEFTYESGGNHYIVLQHPYLKGSVSIYVNGEKLSDSQIGETTPEAGEVFYQGTSGPDIVAVCYVYTDCPQAIAPICIFEVGPSFNGGLLAFSDRFDKTPSTEPWGGYGYWYTPSTSYETPLQINSFSGVASLNHYYTFEDIRGSGIISEIILGVEFTNNSTGLQIDGIGSLTSGFGLTSTGIVTLVGTYRYKHTSSPLEWSFGTVSQSFPALSFTMKQKLFIRWRILQDSWEAKVWPMDQEEPSTWLQFTSGLPSGGSITAGTAEWINYDFIGGHVTGNVLTYGIEHWVGNNSGVYGRWDPINGAKQEPTVSTGYSWYKETPHGDNSLTEGGTYFTYYDRTDQFYEYNTGNNTDLGDTFPTHTLNFATSFFGPDYSHKDAGTTQQVISYDTSYGKATSFKITGEVRWAFSSATQYSPSILTILLDAHSYGDGVPPVSGKVIAGTTKAILGQPVSLADSTIINAPEGARWRSAWAPFEIEVPTTGNHVQWGARFLQTPDEIEAQLGNVDVDSFLRNTILSIEFRTIYIEATMSPLGPARTICPGGSLSDRCSTLYDSFNQGQTFDNCDGDIYYMNADSGHQWEIADYLTKIETNGSFLTTFRAPGITTDGSDGRCPMQNEHYQTIDKSLGWSNAQLTSFAPPACGNFSVSAQIKFGLPGPVWTVTHSDNPFYIGQEIEPHAVFRIGHSSSSYVELSVYNNRAGFSGQQVIGPSAFIDSGITSLSYNTPYNIYIESTSTYYGVKLWRADIQMPDAWTMYGSTYSTFKGSEIVILHQYEDYIDDDFYIELSNLIVAPLETVI